MNRRVAVINMRNISGNYTVVIKNTPEKPTLHYLGNNQVHVFGTNAYIIIQGFKDYRQTINEILN